MNLRSFVEGLTLEERDELLDILTQQSENSSTMPPHIEAEFSSSSDNTFTMHKPNSISSQNRKQAVQAKENTWVDEGEDRDIKTPEAKRTPRNRTPPQKVTVVCSACGKSFEEDKRFVFGEFTRCSSCAVRR